MLTLHYSKSIDCIAISCENSLVAARSLILSKNMCGQGRQDKRMEPPSTHLLLHVTELKQIYSYMLRCGHDRALNSTAERWGPGEIWRLGAITK